MRARRGYSLNLVMILSASLVVLLASMLVVLANSAQTSGELIQRKQTFFAADGMMRAIVKVANDFLRENPSANTADLTAAFDTETMDAIRPAGYTAETFTISTEGAGPGVVPNGAFQGMNANLFPINASLKLRKTTSLASSKQSMAATLAQIGMFQFMVFIDGFGDWHPGPPQRVNGRVHANGDLCVGSDAELCLTKVTAAGRLMHASDARCRDPHTVGPAFIARDETPDLTCGDSDGTPDPSKWGALGREPDRENGCTNCDGSGALWATWARTEFSDNALDVAMSVPALRLPITGSPRTQAGKNADNAVAPNQSPFGPNSRFVVDPVLPTDSADVRQQKYASKSQIRIIDGVWYLRDPSDPNAWPGMAVWSDHPGSYTITAALSPDEHVLVGTRAVGQSDIKAALSSRGVPWDVSAPPRLFSYYEVDDATFTMLDRGNTATGVISYGTLARKDTDGDGVRDVPAQWAPGHWGAATRAGPATDPDLCPAGSTHPPVADPFQSVFDLADDCSDALDYSIDTALLNATRSGFRDGHVEQRLGMSAVDAGGETHDSYDASGVVLGSVSKHQKILPTNFDIAAFRVALTETAPGELGSYFCPEGGGCFMREPFNGVVWISNTWGGSMNGFAAGAAGTVPALWPPQGQQVNASVAQPRPRDSSSAPNPRNPDTDVANTALPYPLCGGVGAAPTFRATLPATLPASAVVPFRVPNCADFTGGLGARPNAVRMHNGGVVALDYDTASVRAGPDGMSFVSNMPVYVLGEWNVRDEVATAIDTSGPTASPWVPAMVGGDQVYLLSNNWDDQNLPWDVDVSPTSGSARATGADTTYNIQILAGWSESANGQYSGGIENFPRFLESWGSTNTINGSLVAGFNSVYFHWPRLCCGNMSYTEPVRAWAFDTHLNTIANQPPGSPEYNVYATRAWTRR